MKELIKKIWVIIMTILISLSVIFSSFGSTDNARPNSRRRKEAVVKVVDLESDE